MIYIKKDFEPDYNNLILAAKNQKPKRMPLYEHIISGKIIEQITGKKLYNDTGNRKSDIIEYYKNFNAFFKLMGYDAVCFELSSAACMPGSGSLGGHKDGEIKTQADCDKYEWDKIPEIYFSEARGYPLHIECMREAIPAGMKLVGGVANGIFECVQDVVGYMDLCYIKSDDPDLYKTLFRKVGEMLYKIWDRFTDLYDDLFCVYRFGDDLGYKLSPMLSPDDIRAYIIPEYVKIISMIKRKTGKPFLLHSCGNLDLIMDDLIYTVKIDSRHSNEDVIMPFVDMVKKYGDRIGLFGGIDTDALCDVSGIDIESYTHAVVDPIKDKGGIAIGSGNSITDYVSVDRYAKMNEIVRKLRGE
jgi:uroporphyrinogen decarboxylase